MKEIGENMSNSDSDQATHVAQIVRGRRKDVAKLGEELRKIPQVFDAILTTQGYPTWSTRNPNPVPVPKKK